MFHDVVGKNFNIDHVVIGDTGIFTIETKTYRKPMRRSCQYSFRWRSHHCEWLQSRPQSRDSIFSPGGLAQCPDSGKYWTYS
ncbi:MAG: nuclease-related domain-containing protein [Phormidesmis sp.]